MGLPVLEIQRISAHPKLSILTEFELNGVAGIRIRIARPRTSNTNQVILQPHDLGEYIRFKEVLS